MIIPTHYKKKYIYYFRWTNELEKGRLKKKFCSLCLVIAFFSVYVFGCVFVHTQLGLCNCSSTAEFPLESELSSWHEADLELYSILYWTAVNSNCVWCGRLLGKPNCLGCHSPWTSLFKENAGERKGRRKASQGLGCLRDTGLQLVPSKSYLFLYQLQS